MLNNIVVFSLVMCVLNWLLFVGITLIEDLPELRKVINALTSPPSSPGGIGVTVTHSGIDPAKLAAAIGSLAGAFKKAGAAPTAAALSVLFLLAALAAAGIAKI